MFTLVSVKDVLDAMGQDPALLKDSTPAVTSALIRAKVRLESLLGSELSLQTVTDTFFIDTREGHPVDDMWRLRLSNGCIREDADVSYGYGEFNGTYSPDPISDGWLDRDKGILYVPAQNDYYLRRYVQVSYTSGFSEEDESIPEELRQAILCLVPLLLLSSSSSTSEPKQQASNLAKANSLDAMAADMLPRFYRNVGALLRPRRTVRERISS